MSNVVLSNMVHLPIDLLSEGEYTSLKEKLTVYPKKFDNKEPDPIILYRESDKYFSIPNEAGLHFLNCKRIPFVDMTTIGDKIQTKCTLPSPYHENVNNPERQKQFMDDLYDSVTQYNRCLASSPTGCVSGDTEYLSEDGWHKISEYNPVHKIMIYDAINNYGYFDYPIKYISIPADRWVVIESKYGISQKLCPEHNMFLRKSWGDKGLMSIKAEDFVVRHNNTRHGTSLGFPSCFIFKNNKNYFKGFSESSLRVLVAVIADGYFPNKNDTVYVHIKKERKKIRLRNLLMEANIDYKEAIGTCTGAGYSTFSFSSPMKIKEFTSDFYKCSLFELKIIAQESLFWDGNQKNAFYSTNKKSADFIQYAFSAQNKRASMWEDIREGKPLCYTVHVSDRISPTLDCPKGRKTLKWTQGRIDENKYCFQTKTGGLVLRRNNHVFVTGNSGKTVVGLYVAAKLKRKTAILVDQENMMSQWADEIHTKLNVPRERIGKVQGSTCDFEDKDFVLCMVQSLFSRFYSQDFYSSIGTVIFDEIHVFGAPKFQLCSFLFPAKYKIGLSATPYRSDGTEFCFTSHLGEVRVSSEDTAIETDVYMREYYSRDAIWGSNQNAKIKCVSLDKERTSIVARIAKRMYDKERNILIIAKSIEHVEFIKKKIIEFGILEYDVGQYTGKRSAVILDEVTTVKVIKKFEKTPKEDLLEAKEKRVIVATMNMMKKAVSIIRLDSIIIAIPVADPIQIIGRVRRPAPDKQKPVCYYIIDMNDRTFQSFANKFKRLCVDNNMNVHILDAQDKRIGSYAKN